MQTMCPPKSITASLAPADSVLQIMRRFMPMVIPSLISNHVADENSEGAETIVVVKVELDDEFFAFSVDRVATVPGSSGPMYRLQLDSVISDANLAPYLYAVWDFIRLCSQEALEITLSWGNDAEDAPETKTAPEALREIEDIARSRDLVLR